jgi:hypothetical protein
MVFMEKNVEAKAKLNLIQKQKQYYFMKMLEVKRSF